MLIAINTTMYENDHHLAPVITLEIDAATLEPFALLRINEAKGLGEGVSIFHPPDSSVATLLQSDIFILRGAG
ncbi:MAG: hypothetical protein HYX91_03400 [Chloroflexi bacterium]|nr:hypothetical protein [Chloroflexota bacterium]